jgi:hypothetical protein
MNALLGEWQALTAEGRDRLAAALVLGYRIGQKKTGNRRYPLAVQLQDHRGQPVGHPGGGLFGWSWHESEEVA